MIYQIDGKNVKEEPKGNFKRIVVIPGKLKNFITKEGDKEVNASFFFKFTFKGLMRLIIALCKNVNSWTHIAIVTEGEDDYRFYVNGERMVE